MSSIRYVATELHDCNLKTYIIELMRDESLDKGDVGQQCLEIAKQAAIGLQLIHTRKWVHKDIKPSNFLILRKNAVTGEGPKCRLTDFGFAKPILPGMSYTELTYQLGTTCYVAPELLIVSPTSSTSNTSTGIRETEDYRVFKQEHDVWAMGCVLHFILTGVHPFIVNNALYGYPTETHSNILCGTPTEEGQRMLETIGNSVRGGKVGVKQLISKMIHKEPSERPNMDEVVKEIKQWRYDLNPHPEKQLKTLANGNFSLDGHISADQQPVPFEQPSKRPNGKEVAIESNQQRSGCKKSSQSRKKVTVAPINANGNVSQLNGYLSRKTIQGNKQSKLEINQLVDIRKKNDWLVNSEHASTLTIMTVFLLIIFCVFMFSCLFA